MTAQSRLIYSLESPVNQIAGRLGYRPGIQHVQERLDFRNPLADRAIGPRINGVAIAMPIAPCGDRRAIQQQIDRFTVFLTKFHMRPRTIGGRHQRRQTVPTVFIRARGKCEVLWET